MNVGLVDADNWGRLDNCFPNLPLMKLSAYHKKNGDFVEWCQESKYYDVQNMAIIYATLIIKGKKTFADVPERIKDKVKEVLTDLDCPELAE